MQPIRKQRTVPDEEMFALLLGDSPSDAGDHPWIDDVEEVSIGESGRVFVVRFDTGALPAFILDNDRFDVREIWVDTVPGGLRRAILGAETCRRLGWGRTGLSAMIRVLPGDEHGCGGGGD